MLHGATEGDRFDIGSGRSLVALPADHRMPALGWAVVERRSQLLPELSGLNGREIQARKAAGQAIVRHHDVTLLAVSGDTLASAAERCAELQEAAVVLHEVTLLCDTWSPALAHAGGHTHLHDLRDSAAGARCRHFVPYHISQRYDAATARRLLVDALGARFGDRLLPLLPPS